MGLSLRSTMVTLVASLVLAPISSAQAEPPAPERLADRSAHADVTLYARVVERRYEPTDDWVTTVVTLDVIDVLGGTPEYGTVELLLGGGEYPDGRIAVSPQTNWLLDVGTELVFTGTYETKGALRVTPGGFVIIRGHAQGRDVALDPDGSIRRVCGSLLRDACGRVAAPAVRGDESDFEQMADGSTRRGTVPTVTSIRDLGEELAPEWPRALVAIHAAFASTCPVEEAP